MSAENASRRHSGPGRCPLIACTDGARRIVRALALGASLAVMAGCASAPERSLIEAGSPFDGQMLLGWWAGEWRTFETGGDAYLNVSEVEGDAISGRIILEGYSFRGGSASQVESRVTGNIVRRAGGVRLVLRSGVGSVDLRIVRDELQGVLGEATVPSMLTSVVLRQAGGNRSRVPTP